MMTGATFTALTLIGAPALLTNATSVLLMSTANRLGRSVDRARALAEELGAEGPSDVLERQAGMADKRVLLTVRAMTALYVAVGAFAASTLSAFLSALSSPRANLFYEAAVAATIGTGVAGFAALVLAAFLLVRESHIAYGLLHGEMRRATKPSRRARTF